MPSSDSTHLTYQDLAMSQKQNITDVLMVGATGSIGRLAVEAAQRHGLRPRALVRDVRRAERLLPGVELARGDLEDPASLRRVVGGADAIVLAHGSGGDPDTRRRVDYGGVRNIRQALGGARPRAALMTSIYSTRRPGWFDQVGPTRRRLVLEQGGTADGGIARDQIAETLVRSLLTDAALGKTF